MTKGKLINIKTGEEVHVGDTILSFRGEPVKVLGWYTKPAPSSGRVVVADDDGEYEYYPSVFDCKIVEEEE